MTPSADRIAKHVAKFLGYTVADLIRRDRSQGVSDARRHAAWAMRKLTRMSYPEIARYFARTHHWSWWAVHDIDVARGDDPQFRATTDAMLVGLKDDPRPEWLER